MLCKKVPFPLEAFGGICWLSGGQARESLGTSTCCQFIVATYFFYYPEMHFIEILALSGVTDELWTISHRQRSKDAQGRSCQGAAEDGDF